MLKGAIVLDLDECLGEFRMLSTLYWALDQYEFKNLIGNSFDKNKVNKIIGEQVIEQAFRPGLKRFLLAINALKERINYKVILFTNHYNPPFTDSINDILKYYLGINKFLDCIIDSGTVIGADGFGWVTDKGNHHKIPHIGKVIIHDNVWIGANCCIDRGTFGDTIINKYSYGAIVRPLSGKLNFVRLSGLSVRK